MEDPKDPAGLIRAVADSQVNPVFANALRAVLGKPPVRADLPPTGTEFLGIAPEEYHHRGLCAACFTDNGVTTDCVGWFPVWEEWTPINCYGLDCVRCRREFAPPTDCNGDCGGKCEVAHERRLSSAEMYHSDH